MSRNHPPLTAFLAGLLATFSLTLATSTWGITMGTPVGNTGSPSATDLCFGSLDRFGGIGGWLVPTLCAPLQEGGYYPVADIFADESAGPWRKYLVFGDGETVVNDTIIEAGNSFLLVEGLRVSDGSPAWTDWHETILNPAWSWIGLDEIGAPYDVDALLLPGNGNPSAGTIDGQDLSFDFDPLVPGTNILVVKALVCDGVVVRDNNIGCRVGLSGLTGQGLYFPIVIDEYPTVPEPATLALLGLGLAGMGFVRKRVKM